MRLQLREHEGLDRDGSGIPFCKEALYLFGAADGAFGLVAVHNYEPWNPNSMCAPQTPKGALCHISHRLLDLCGETC